MDLLTSPHLLKYSETTEIVKAKTFSRTINPRSRREEYVEPLNEDRRDDVHWGQRKLLLSEIEFLTLEYDKVDHTKPVTVLYVGAAEGNHIYMLAKDLFPQFEYHLFDKREFYPKLAELENVKIFKRYFDDKDAKSYKGKNLFFICDIRGLDIGKAKEHRNFESMDTIVLDDMKMQEDWYNIMKPKSALLKFRLPWFKGKTKYLDGTIYFQVWQKLHSTESRLIPNGKTKYYDHTAYEERMFYFNRHTRRKRYKQPYKFYGHCYDCKSETVILEEYIKRFRPDTPEKKLPFELCKLGREITSELNKASKRTRYLFPEGPLSVFKI